MKLFFRYLKQHGRLIAVLVLFAVIFGAVFAMYRLPVKAVLYPCAVCGVLGVLFMLIDFFRVKRQHAELERLLCLSWELIDGLPASDSIAGEDYNQLILSLKEQSAQLKAEFSEKYRDMTEYYTLWVHQIKTPIASMGLTLQNEDSPTARKLQGDLFRIEQYVEMVMAFLRLDSDTGDYVFKEHSVDTIVKQAVKSFSHEFIDRKIALEYEPIDKTVITDGKWLGFVLEQIISNALKYTREGSVKIYLEKPSVLCIEDTGIGIAPQHKTKHAISA